MRILNRFGFLIIFLLFYTTSQAQNICEDGKYEQGGFKLSSTDICHTETVTIENTGGVSNAVYYYNFKSQSYNELKAMGSPNETLDFSAIDKSGLYTVVQVGEKNGKKSVACVKDVKVKVADQPVFSYNYCYSLSGGDIEIYIPSHPVNDFQSYEITINGDVTQVSSLPFNQVFRANSGNKLSVKGIGGSCGSSSKEYTANYDLMSGSSLENFPNIEQLKVIDDNQIEINFSGMYNHEYELKRYEAGNKPLFVPTVASTVPSQMSVVDNTISDATSKPYCYYVQKKGNPICGLSTLISSTICTNPIKQIQSSSNLKNIVSFLPNDSPKRNALFQTYKITTELQKTSGSEFIIIDNNKILINSYEDKDIDCTQEICYRVKTTISGNNVGALFESVSYSNEECKSYKLAPFDAPPNVFVNTTENNTNNIRFQNNPTSVFFTSRWVLYKDIEGKPTAIDSVYENQDARSGLFDHDEVSQSEVYRMVLVDQCENRSEFSDPVHSIFLESPLKNMLNWSQGSPFVDEEPDQLEVIYYNNDKVTEKVSFDELPHTSQHSVDTGHFESFGNFRIKAYAASGRISFSNLITIPIYGDLNLPTVFTPNTDGYNDVLKLRGKEDAINEFVVEIFSSYGAKITELNNSQRSWDGKLSDGSAAQVGPYLYQFKATMKNGQIIQKSGTFLLIR